MSVTELLQAAQFLVDANGNKKAVMLDLAEAFGFHLSRVKGSHQIFVHPQVRELVNLQNVGGKAKPYQVRQFLRLVERYNLTMGDKS